MNNNLEIIVEYFETIKTLIVFKENKIINKIKDCALMNVLKIYKKGDEFDFFKNIISNSNSIQTLGDASAVNLHEIENDTEKFVLDYKADMVRGENIHSLKMFDENMFIKELKAKIIYGSEHATKLLALLEYYGLVVNADVDDALKYYKMLALSKDLFSIKMLIMSYEENNKQQEKEVWESVLNVQLKNNLIKINKNMIKCYRKEINEICILMEAVQSRKINKKKENLDIYMLEYLIVSENKLEEKLENVLNYKSDGCSLLIYENLYNEKMGFN